MTDGLRSSEFWMTALMIVCAAGLIAIDKLSVDQLGALWPLFGGSGAYAIGRSIVKGLGSARESR